MSSKSTKKLATPDENEVRKNPTTFGAGKVAKPVELDRDPTVMAGTVVDEQPDAYTSDVQVPETVQVAMEEQGTKKAKKGAKK